MNGIAAQSLDERFARSIDQPRFHLRPLDISTLGSLVHRDCREQQRVVPRPRFVESSAAEIEPMS